MTRKALILEPDPPLHALLTRTLTDMGIETIEADISDVERKLSSCGPLDAVLWSSSLLQGVDPVRLRAKREAREVWLLMTEPDTVELCPKPFDRVLIQPFRSDELECALQGIKEQNGEDPLLHFMRERERQFSRFRRKEHQLREAHKHLKELERMKNTFLSLVSHELRTPLTIISGNLHVLRKLASKWNNEIASECLCSAQEGTTRLSKLVDELLRFTISVPQQRDRWDLRLTLGRLIGDLQPLARSRGLDLTLNADSLPIEGDPAGLPDALHQLIENALLFNRPGGKVEVTGRRAQVGECIEICVCDDGPGIEGTELEKVFHPFYQVADVNTRSVEGLGLGLALARRTIESHGGRLLLESVIDQGTKATITLPIRSEALLPSLPGDEALRPPEASDTHSLKEYAQQMYERLEAEKMKRRHAEEQKLLLEQTFIETLISLIRLVDPRMSGTTSQSERVLDYARAVARHLDPTLLSRPEFLYSLLLYDIGKIGVAEAVLSKSGDLTDQERRSAQAHAEIGAELLTSVGVLQPAIDAVRSHHERWDGSGYPDGLKGREIPILARIIAVVDSFDAMTVDRPYRQALSLPDARRQIEEGAGRAFDPQVVEAFQKGWSEIEEASHKANATYQLRDLSRESEPVR